MNLNNLFFYIHYCNSREYNSTRPFKKKIARTLQHHELILITGGKGTVTNDGKHHGVKDGMLFYLCPGIPHCIESDSENPICFLSVHFSYSYINFDEGKWNIRDRTRVLPLPPVQQLKEYYPVNDLFKKMVDSWDSKLPGYEFITKTMLQQLLVVIFQSMNNQNRNYSNSIKVEKAIKYLHERINSRVTLEELAGLVQLSPAYLSRTFKDTAGYSPIGYFNKLKIDKAKELLIEGDKKIKEVAQSLGFSDEFYFSRIFKKIEGVSPSEFHSKNVHGV